MQTVIFELKNNIRVVLQPSGGSRVTHIALMINVGTRNEVKGKEGLAHFIEHVFFKGTRKRKSFHILNRLDSVGGELNAFTAKEETCLYATVMTQHTERAFELISDIFFNSVFPEKELEKEKQVIIDEIRTYEDTPSEQIIDDFEGQVFRRHGLGNPVLGLIDTVNSIGRQDILEFIRNNYAGDKIVLSVVSDFSSEKIKYFSEKYFSNKIKSSAGSKLKKFNIYKPMHQTIEKTIAQSHVVIGNMAFSFHHKNKFAMALLNNILGGPGMNSRLNLNIREKYGLTYQIDSNFSTYADTGIFSVYFATDSKSEEKTRSLVYREFQKLRQEKINEVQLKKYKEQLIGQLTMSYENKAGLGLSAAKNLLCFNKIDSPEQIKNNFERVSAAEIVEVANIVFNENTLSSLHFKPPG